ncbi:DUF397 domain-containing protein [Amycolatopsis antarctica]|uniref:DUF397 domain-containing protein n=1 Tax=Amycolatopsis antarctica TaxID=1854586 RepID=A0A263D6M3_9PSEU|nr:DUF397 domain-containing protein [Amycolatopsis antarctica]OZM73839.1 DUF397 domain-containing protein [Amycolatopsis antarctica]
MTAADQRSPGWRKSSHSNANDSCVEVDFVAAEVAVRDSKDPASGVLRFGPARWRAFTGHIAGLRA